MTWAEHHSRSELFAGEAHEALMRGDLERAQALFGKAAEAEAAALHDLPDGKPRTLGITAVSATALWYKGGELEAAEQVAHAAAARSGMPAFAQAQLRELLQAIWNEQAQREAGVSFIPGQVTVSVKGGEVVTGGAPLDLILSKVQAVQNLFYRTAEFLKDLPLRLKGQPSKELHDRYRPWLFQGVPSSYQFAVAIQKPPQHELFPTGEPEPEVLTETFLRILRAASEDPEQRLREVVPKEDYRQTFLKMTRNLAPTGKSFSEIEIKSAGERDAVILLPASRKIITETLRSQNASGEEQEDIVLRGNLRAVNLDKKWLGVSVDGITRHISGLAEAVDDIIGPMVNHDVIVRARQGKNNRLIFIDIEQDE
jgi:hypothetical protein